MLAVSIHGNCKHIRATRRTGEGLLLAHDVDLITHSVPLKETFDEAVS